MKLLRAARRTVAIVVVGTTALVLFSSALVPGKEEKEIAGELYGNAPSAAPQVQFLDTFSSPEDLKLKRTSWFRGLLNKLIGIEDSESRMIFPYGLTTDGAGRLITVDARLRTVHVFDVKNKAYVAIKPQKPEQFVSPIGVAVDAVDNIYVSDSYEGKIFIFNKKGKLQDVIGKPEGRFKRATGLAIDKAEKRLYVVDTVRNEVVVMDLHGRDLFRFGEFGDGDGQFNAPTQICLKNNKLYVTDTLNARIQVFDRQGRFLSRFGRRGIASGELDKPKGVAVDSEGHIYVVEGLHDAVQIFDQEGDFLLAFGSTGFQEGEFYLPTGIHIDAEDRIFVADSFNSRIAVFKYLRKDTAVR